MFYVGFAYDVADCLPDEICSATLEILSLGTLVRAVYYFGFFSSQKSLSVGRLDDVSGRTVI